MLKICTVYFQDYYTPDYVDKLYDSLKRNSTVDFQFICLSDTENVKADLVLPYNRHDDIKRHWHKLKFFSPQFAYQQPEDEIIIMDIDQIIVGDVDPLLTWPVTENELITYGSWWDNKLKINGGFYKFKSGSLKFVWDDFIDNANYWQLHYYNEGTVHYKYYGEQNYVNWKMQEHNAKITRTPEQWLTKYTDNYTKNLDLNKLYSKKFKTDHMILDDVNENIKIVHFTGPNRNIHENKSNFIRKYWK